MELLWGLNEIICEKDLAHCMSLSKCSELAIGLVKNLLVAMDPKQLKYREVFNYLCKAWTFQGLKPCQLELSSTFS